MSPCSSTGREHCTAVLVESPAGHPASSYGVGRLVVPLPWRSHTYRLSPGHSLIDSTQSGCHPTIAVPLPLVLISRRAMHPCMYQLPAASALQVEAGRRLDPAPGLAPPATHRCRLMLLHASDGQTGWIHARDPLPVPAQLHCMHVPPAASFLWKVHMVCHQPPAGSHCLATLTTEPNSQCKFEFVFIYIRICVFFLEGGAVVCKRTD